MSLRCLLAMAAACLIGFSATLALALSTWARFSDPTHEISVMLPVGVKASQSLSGSAAYKVEDGDVIYIVSFRKRSTRDQEAELQNFCANFTKGFEEVEAESGRQTKIELSSQTQGKNWKGRIYRYIKPSGDPGAFEIAVSDRHNFVLHVVGGNDTAPNTKRFFSSFEVN
jgi:hypothetical protein